MTNILKEPAVVEAMACASSYGAHAGGPVSKINPVDAMFTLASALTRLAEENAEIERRERALGERYLKTLSRAEAAEARALKTEKECDESLAHGARLAEALRLIASEIRPDGSWNRDREACRAIALSALSHRGQEKP